MVWAWIVNDTVTLSRRRSCTVRLRGSIQQTKWECPVKEKLQCQTPVTAATAHGNTGWYFWQSWGIKYVVSGQVCGRGTGLCYNAFRCATFTEQWAFYSCWSPTSWVTWSSAMCSWPAALLSTCCSSVLYLCGWSVSSWPAGSTSDWATASVAVSTLLSLCCTDDTSVCWCCVCFAAGRSTLQLRNYYLSACLKLKTTLRTQSNSHRT